MSDDYAGGSQGPGPWVRRMQNNITTKSGVLSAAQQLLPANPNRYFVSFSFAQGSGSAIVKPQSAPVSSEGYQVSANFAPVKFSFNYDGALVQESWWIAAGSLSATLMIVEGVWLAGSEP